jgi:uncharacterized protein (TIGR02270 family)
MPQLMPIPQSPVPAIDRSPVPVVVMQHAEDAAALRTTRSVLVRAPHVKLRDLRRGDDRLAAHLDGLSIAGEYGWRLAESALERPGVGEVFVATIRAIEMRKTDALRRLLALAGAMPDTVPGLVSAFGWVSAPALQGIAKALLSSADPLALRIGLAACALHRVDPGEPLTAAPARADALLRAAALRIAGLCARQDMRGACLQALHDDDPSSRFWAARSAVLLGDRGVAAEQLLRMASVAGPHHEAALALALKLVDPASCTSLLKPLHDAAQNHRLVVRATGLCGDIRYVPWLIQQMNDPTLARLAGESFSFITGADLAWLDLEGEPPDEIEFGPNDDPEDDNVAMDEDDSLPWPDPAKVQDWWTANMQRFAPGVRYFVGEPPSRDHCLGVLRDGYQRQRIAAAEHLCLLEPGRPLFNTAAPAWRQQRLLAQATA